MAESQLLRSLIAEEIERVPITEPWAMDANELGAQRDLDHAAKESRKSARLGRRTLETTHHALISVTVTWGVCRTIAPTPSSCMR